MRDMEAALFMVCAALAATHYLMVHTLAALAKSPAAAPRSSVRVKEYDRPLEILEEEQGEWYVKLVLERELGLLYRHYTRDADGLGEATESGESSEECDCPCHSP